MPSTTAPALPAAYVEASAAFAAAIDVSKVLGRMRATTYAENGFSADQLQQADRIHLVEAFKAAHRWRDEIAALDASLVKQEQDRLAALLAGVRHAALVWEFGGIAGTGFEA